MTEKEIDYQKSKPYNFEDLEFSLHYRIKENERLRNMLSAEVKAHAETRLDLKRAKGK